MLLVDDHPVFAEALAARLDSEPDLLVLPVAHTVGQALAGLSRGRPEVVLVDLVLGTETGLTVLDQARTHNPDTNAMVLTAMESVDAAVEAVRRGALGWLPKHADVATLISAIHVVALGGAWIPPDLLGPVLTRLVAPQSAASDPLAVLTAREREVLQCLVDGMPRTEIARRLFLSKNTVRTHAQNLLEKLGSHSVLEAVAIARQAGMRESGTT